jgi:predicted double-glycine peptidase
VNPIAEGSLSILASVIAGAVAHKFRRFQWVWFIAGLGGILIVLVYGSELRGRITGCVLSVSIPIIIAPLLHFRLSRITRNGLVIATLIATGYSGWMEFFAPALSRPTLRGLTTLINGQGVCLQTTDFTCGPAATVTLLHRLGLSAEEGEIGILSKTSFFGADATLLADAVNQRYRTDGVHASVKTLRTLDELKASVPCATVIYYDFTTDHWVTVLNVSDGKVELGDPISGKRTASTVEFMRVWRHESLLVTRSGFVSNDVASETPSSSARLTVSPKFAKHAIR